MMMQIADKNKSTKYKIYLGQKFGVFYFKNSDLEKF